MAYSTSQMISKLGVTRQMLRYYESYGLIDPKREENGYRRYSDLDGFQILRTKVMQSLQVSVQDIRERIEANDLSARLELLRQSEQLLQEQIHILQARLERVRVHRQFVEDALFSNNEITEKETYGIYKLSMLGEGVQDVGDDIAKQWLEHLPIAEIGWLIPWNEQAILSDAVLPAQLGLEVLPELAEKHLLHVEKPVCFFPAGYSVRMMMSLQDPFYPRGAQLMPLYQYCKRKGYRVISDISGRYSGSDLVNGQIQYFFSARVLVENA